MPLPLIDCIVTSRLHLLPLTEAHLPDLMAVSGDEEVTRFLPYKTWTSDEDAQAWFERLRVLTSAGTSQQLVLTRRIDGLAIGTLLLFKHDEGSRRIELGYALGRAHWRQGLMMEAVQAAIHHAFTALDIRRIEAEANPANIASCQLLAQAGFQLEGTLRQRWTAKGETYDTHLYGLLVDDLRPTLPRLESAA